MVLYILYGVYGIMRDNYVIFIIIKMEPNLYIVWSGGILRDNYIVKDIAKIASELDAGDIGIEQDNYQINAITKMVSSRDIGITGLVMDDHHLNVSTKMVILFKLIFLYYSGIVNIVFNHPHNVNVFEVRYDVESS